MKDSLPAVTELSSNPDALRHSPGLLSTYHTLARPSLHMYILSQPVRAEISSSGSRRACSQDNGSVVVQGPPAGDAYDRVDRDSSEFLRGESQRLSDSGARVRPVPDVEPIMCEWQHQIREKM